jgi:TatD DNase family protein
LILHNREAKEDVLKILRDMWDYKLESRSVFHCCEPDEELLEFAKTHKMFLGVDGDITYYPEKQEFIKKVPLEMLVLETDAPFLLPEPLKTQKLYPNEPKNMKITAEYIAKLRRIDVEEVVRVTMRNACKLFDI